MDEKLFMFIYCLKFYQIIHDTTSSIRTSKYSQKGSVLVCWRIACCKLTPTLATQMWRHNYFIGCNNFYVVRHHHSLSMFTAIFVWIYTSFMDIQKKLKWAFFLLNTLYLSEQLAKWRHQLSQFTCVVCMISSRHVQVRQLYSCVDCDLSVSLDVIRGRRTVDDRWGQLV